MVIGENARNDDMDVNITKEKKLTNMRSSTADNFEKLTPPRQLSLEESLEFARDDECVEVTPRRSASARSTWTSAPAPLRARSSGAGMPARLTVVEQGSHAGQTFPSTSRGGGARAGKGAARSGLGVALATSTAVSFGRRRAGHPQAVCPRGAS